MALWYVIFGNSSEIIASLSKKRKDSRPEHWNRIIEVQMKPRARGDPFIKNPFSHLLQPILYQIAYVV
ncbi:hypothetical protein DYY65_09425 [Nitrososphaera sp. AFS]|nr:hypothetical protein [Nitrososphaera sp. AFS]